MNIKWTKECYLCECPLEPCVHTKTTEERILVREYRKIRPIFTINNDMYLKFFGTDVKRVCYACYINSYKVGITTLRDRLCLLLRRLSRIRTRDNQETEGFDSWQH